MEDTSVIGARFAVSCSIVVLSLELLFVDRTIDDCGANSTALLPPDGGIDSFWRLGISTLLTSMGQVISRVWR